MIDGVFEFTYRPVPNKRIANTLFFGILLVSVIPVVFSIISLRYKGLISLGAVALFVAAVAVYARYIVAEYAYVVIYSGDTPMIIVTKTIGKRVTTLMSLPLSCIFAVCEKGQYDAARVKEKGIKKYNFAVSILPKSAYVLSAKTRYENMLVMLEGSAEFASRISEYSLLAKEYEAAHEDEY
jgi:hypothetical protein